MSDGKPFEFEAKIMEVSETTSKKGKPMLKVKTDKGLVNVLIDKAGSDRPSIGQVWGFQGTSFDVHGTESRWAEKVWPGCEAPVPGLPSAREAYNEQKNERLNDIAVGQAVNLAESYCERAGVVPEQMKSEMHKWTKFFYEFIINIKTELLTKDEDPF